MTAIPNKYLTKEVRACVTQWLNQLPKEELVEFYWFLISQLTAAGPSTALSRDLPHYPIPMSLTTITRSHASPALQIGRASCRERV